MASLNVNGIVRLTRDCEVNKTTAGTWYNFGVAAFRKNVKEGKQKVDFFDCELYQVKPPPGITDMLKKGRLMYIEKASLRNDQFMGQDGKEKNKWKVIITSFEMLNFEAPTEKVVEKPSSKSIHPSELPPPINMPKMDKKKEEPKKEEETYEVQDEDEDGEEAPF